MLPCQRPFCDWNCILAGSKWFSRSSSKNILYHHCQIFCAYAPACNWICCKAQRHLGCGTWITVYISNSKVPLFSAQGYRKFHLFFLKLFNNLNLSKVRSKMYCSLTSPCFTFLVCCTKFLIINRTIGTGGQSPQFSQNQVTSGWLTIKPILVYL